MNKLLTTVVVFQAAILYTLWTGNSGGPFVSPAHAQIPDAGAQQQVIIDELKAVNAKLDRLATTLDSGRLRVTVNTPAADREPQGGRR